MTHTLRSYSSRSYCCLPGGGYFENDKAVTPFDRYSIFMNFRMEDESSVQISPIDENHFWDNPDHWHLLDGFTQDGNPSSPPRPNSFLAYWNMIKLNQKSGLNSNGRRRRRRVETGSGTGNGKLIMRHLKSRIRRRKRSSDKEYYINEVENPRSKVKGGHGSRSYVRFQNKLGQAEIISSEVIQYFLSCQITSDDDPQIGIIRFTFFFYYDTRGIIS